jgi:pyruvate kinase
MVSKPRPTRAEASDVANAILDGTDAVMLSDETAVGRHPIEAVAMIREISAITEEDVRAHLDVRSVTDDPEHAIADAVSEATARIAAAVNARLIVTVTASGYTARRVARERPGRSIVALTPNENVLRRLSLVWGVVPVLVPPFEGVDGMLAAVSDALLDAGYVRPGDLIVITAGLPPGVRGTTNLVKVHRIERSPGRL